MKIFNKIVEICALSGMDTDGDIIIFNNDVYYIDCLHGELTKLDI